MSRLLRVVAIATACLSILSPTVLASGWEPAEVIGQTPTPQPPLADGPRSPLVAADASGNLTVIWAGDGVVQTGVYVTTHAASAPSWQWSGPVQLSAAPDPRGLQLAVNANGQAVAGWVNVLPDATQQLVTVNRSAAGVWSTPTAFTAEATSYEGHALQIDPVGRAIGVFAKGAAGTFGAISQQTGSAPALAAGPAATTDTKGGAPFDLAVDADGNATVLYLDAAGLKLFSATRASAAPWQTPQLVDQWTPPAGVEGAALSSPHLAVNASGRAVAVWIRGSDEAHGVESSTRAAGGTWSPSVALAPVTDGRLVRTTDVGIDAAGNTTAAWNMIGIDASVVTRADGIHVLERFWTEVRSSTAPVGGDWAAASVRAERQELVVDLTEAQETPVEPGEETPGLAAPIYDGVEVAVGASGSSAVTWISTVADKAFVASAVRPRGGTWGPSIHHGDFRTRGIDDPSSVASTIVDATDRGTVVWSQGSTIFSSGITLSPAVVDPDPTPTSPEPTTPVPTIPEPAPATPAAGAGTPSSPANTLLAAPISKLVVVMYLVPRGKKCPATANATVAGVRTAMKVKRAKIRGALRCRVTGTIVLKTPTKAGTLVDVLVTAKGVKRKPIKVAASR